MCCAHTRTHTCRHKPCVRCRAKPCMSFLFMSSSPATLLQPECWLDIDQPHESPSNEQYEPKGRASGKEADYHHTSKRQKPQLLKSPSSSFRQELYFERNQPGINYTKDVFLHAKVARVCVCFLLSLSKLWRHISDQSTVITPGPFRMCFFFQFHLQSENVVQQLHSGSYQFWGLANTSLGQHILLKKTTSLRRCHIVWNENSYLTEGWNHRNPENLDKKMMQQACPFFWYSIAATQDIT